MKLTGYSITRNCFGTVANVKELLADPVGKLAALGKSLCGGPPAHVYAAPTHRLQLSAYVGKWQANGAFQCRLKAES